MKVLAMGTFDVIHPGHIDYLKQAKSMGNYLIVIVSRDKNVLKEKGKLPLVNENDRIEMIKHIDIVDKVLLGNEKDKLKIIFEIKPDIICLGYDHPVNEKELQNELSKRGLKVKVNRAKQYKNYSSSFFKHFT